MRPFYIDTQSFAASRLVPHSQSLARLGRHTELAKHIAACERLAEAGELSEVFWATIEQLVSQVLGAPPIQ